MISFDLHALPLASTSSRGAMAILHDVMPSERLERVKRDFIANVSHEFRTPLATIQGYAETLLEGGLEDENNRRRFVEIIQANGVRLNNIAADLLTLSELEFGRPDAKPDPLYLNDA
jgi:two-component system phosphate regulon sensor histidine kinase PhoR